MDKSVNLEAFIDTSHLLHSGVYALLYRGKIVYIGQSRRLYARIYTHKSLWNRKRSGKPIPTRGAVAHVKVVQFDEVFIRPCPIAQLNQLERELIAQHKPKHNYMLKESVVVPLSVIMQRSIEQKAHTTGFLRRI